MTTLAPLILSRSVSVAFNAVTSVVVNPKIASNVRMALRAVTDCFTNQNASRNRSPISFATPQVLLKRNGFKVAGVYAGPDPAKVIYLQAGRDGSNVGIVRESVSLKGSRALIRSVENLPVAVNVYRAGPEPATGVRFRYEAVEKLLLSVIFGSSHVILLRSLWSGLRGATNAVAARSYFTAFADPARCF